MVFLRLLLLSNALVTFYDFFFTIIFNLHLMTYFFPMLNMWNNIETGVFFLRLYFSLSAHLV